MLVPYSRTYSLPRLFCSLCVSCAGTGRAAIKDLDKRAARREPPGNTEPNDTNTNDGDLWFADTREAIRHDAAPFAGMTQTGSTGLISAANAAAPLAVCKNDGNFCAFLQAPHGRAGPLCRYQKGPTPKYTTVPVSGAAAVRSNKCDVEICHRSVS